MNSFDCKNEIRVVNVPLSMLEYTVTEKCAIINHWKSFITSKTEINSWIFGDKITETDNNLNGAL